MSTCGTCSFWDEVYGGDSNLGKCMAICDNYGPFEKPAQLSDPGGLYTLRTFGCTMHSQKVVEA